MKTLPAITTITEAEAYLSRFLSSRWTYTLGRMHQLMRELGNPETKIPFIHVGGTAGKGSTAFIAATILEKGGYKVGLHTSPHLVSITERLMINRTPISEGKFVQLLNDIIPVVEKIIPTYYEITVAMMFKYFFDERVDIAVVEVGLGGRLDGTNVLTPAVSVINNVGLDHTEILGDTIEKIAADKREIIKAGHPAVSGATQESVRNLIVEKASKVNTPLYLLDRDFRVENIRARIFPDLPPITFDYISKNITLKNLELSLFGRHQATNTAVAITAVRYCGLKVSEKAIRRALSDLHYMGRFEITTIRNTRVIIDGAHNPMKMTALSAGLADHFPDKQFPTLLAVKGDKQVTKMVRILAPHVSHWYVTTLMRQTDWGKSVMFKTDELGKAVAEADPGKPMTLIPDFSEFLSNLNSPDPLLITGSLYLVGAVEEWTKKI